MNVFEEFERLAKQMGQQNIPYMLTGGVAMAFHGLPRFTRDIDLVIASSDLPALERLLKQLEYSQFSKPWQLGKSPLRLHRFLKPVHDQEWIIDVMTSDDPLILDMISRSLTSADGKMEVCLATREDLITLKTLRNSPQDRLDIENLKK